MKRTVPNLCSLKIMVCLLCFCSCLLVHRPALGFTRDDILQPLKNDLKMYEKKLAELNRQVKVRFSQFDAEQKEIEKNLATLEKETQSALEQNEARRQADNIAVLTGWQLITEPEDRLSLPGYERVTMDELLALRDTHKKELEADDSAISSGTRDFFIAGVGMVNKQDLELRSQELAEEKKKLEQENNEGNVRIYCAGLGFVDKKQLETAIATQKESVDDVSKQIAEGTYVISIPGLGDISKKQLQTRIADLKERIKQITQEYKAGTARINRVPDGWLTESALDASQKQLQEKSTAINKLFKQNEYKHLLPIGWSTPKDLDQRIKQLQAEIDTIEKNVAAKQYKIALPDGSWATEKDINKALMNSLLSDEIKAALQKGTKSIDLISQYEIQKKQIEIDKLKKWKDTFKDFFLPLKDSYAQRKKELDALKKEFSIDQALAVEPLQQQLAFLQKSLKQFP